MGFRGVLLSASEDAVATATFANLFRVVCPDASLQIPTNGVPRDAPYVVEQKMLVTDYVTSELQQVTRLSNVLLQHDTLSVLWAAVVPSRLPGGIIPSASTFAFDPHNLVRKLCFTFYFRSAVEFDLFERAHRAVQHLQQYSLLEKSVHLEIAIEQDLATKPRTKSPVTSSVPIPPGHEELKRRQEQLRKTLRKDLQKREAQRQQAQAREICEKAAKIEAERLKAASAEIKRTNESKAVVTPKEEKTEVSDPSATTAIVEVCILCGADSSCRRFAGKFVNHPYLLKDGHGKPVIVCKVCLQQVLKRRVAADRARGGVFPATDDLCGLCTKPVAEIKGESKACTHPQCPRVYCSPCLKKLFGKAQANKVFRVKRWLCPNCETPGESGVKPEEEDSMTQEAETATRKRKRSHDKIKSEDLGTVVDVEEVLNPVVDIETVVARDPATGKAMTVLDYASTYYEFLTGREEQPGPPEDSEDVCFCCKDGGDVVECDWKDCPKVYHPDCLGYVVEENMKWTCPRHRCFKCGFSAHFACRFCVTSFCKTDLPAGVKELGPATAEISDLTYVLCTACDRLSTEALERNKISKELYHRLLHPPSPRKEKRGARQKKRLR